MASVSPKKHSSSERDKTEESSLSPKVPKRIAQYIYCSESHERPRTRGAVKKLVEQHGLGHGDVVNFGDYRDGWSRVVKVVNEGEALSDSDLCWDDDEEENEEKNAEEEGKDNVDDYVEEVNNKDESAQESDSSSDNDYPLYKLAFNCGRDAYLGIPKDILADIDDAVTFYKDIIADAPSLDLQISPRDKFVVDRLGQVPNEWEFTIVYDWGTLEDFLIKVPDRDWDSFDSETITREKVDARYFSRPLMVIEVTFTLNNVNDKSKYDLDVSSIPSNWIIEKVVHGIELTGITWTLSGPLPDGEQVQNTVADALKGIEYEMKVNIED